MQETRALGSGYTDDLGDVYYLSKLIQRMLLSKHYPIALYNRVN